MDVQPQGKKTISASFWHCVVVNDPLCASFSMTLHCVSVPSIIDAFAYGFVISNPSPHTVQGAPLFLSGSPTLPLIVGNDGNMDGSTDGSMEGVLDGSEDGAADSLGSVEGSKDGDAETEGSIDGTELGVSLGATDTLGISDGATLTLGPSLGASEG